jgi:hypothetical protein
MPKKTRSNSNKSGDGNNGKPARSFSTEAV